MEPLVYFFFFFFLFMYSMPFPLGSKARYDHMEVIRLIDHVAVYKHPSPVSYPNSPRNGSSRRPPYISEKHV
ncbi:hypothetical protein V8C34DRAFT_279016 [Trichoderma compactum]